MTSPPLQLHINQTWDGCPVPPQQAVVWTLSREDQNLVLDVQAPFWGDPPAPSTAVGPTAALWEHEVVELFIANAQHRYTEIELSPHGHHLVLQLDGIRNVIREQIPIEFQAQIDGSHWSGRAKIPWHLLPPGPHKVGVFSIHGTAPNRTYLSMTTLPGAQPDFHQLDRFEPITLP